ESPDKAPVASGRRWWLYVPLGCAGFAIVMFLLGWAVISGRARSRWKEFGPRHAQLKARVQGRDGAREPLEGPVLQGNAFPGYVAASAALGKMTGDGKKAIDELLAGRGNPEEKAKGFAALDAHAGDLEALRKATHLSSYQDSLNWDAGWAATLDWIAPFRFSARVLEASARRRREAGDLDGAIDDVAALAQIGVDTASSGPAICYLVGVAVLRMATTQGGALAAEPSLTTAQAARLARLCERAEAALRPLEEILESEHLMINETLAAIAEGRESMDGLGFPAATRFLAWRHGFSWRVVAADVDEAFARISAQGREMSARRWHEAKDAYDRTEKEWRKDTFLSLLYTANSSIDRSGRSIRARLRMVRAVAHEGATGAPLAPVPEDPFTLAPLHRRDSPESTLWWSEWTDGDQGGTGKFEEDPQSGGDIPLEWRKVK
ncbi:MAG: hypothetical protein FD180_1383, partial [Planctomycetota bacterium]